eukprot:TRINITY_DN2362_c0_g1_i1.p1 TRINITY_DN2362_c0_g1~~TRINITY_DN2362_c0_g1_i1.p1  ORF type:complete len:776 (+),score=131.48 TRINITY_DN2362_c0_g1_i1:222-2549(+)
MAEARLAVSAPRVYFSISDEGIRFKADRGAIGNIVGGTRRFILRRAFLVRNAVVSGVWPASPIHWIIVLAVMMGILHGPDDLGHPTLTRYREKWISYTPVQIPAARPVQTFLLAFLTGTVLFLILSLLQRLFLRLLFTYKGWLFLKPGQKSVLVTMWGALVKLITWQKPLLSSFQGVLPRLPVPSLDVTCQRYLQSVRPVLKPEEYSQAQAMTAAFLANEGPKLQRYLWLRSLFVNNWVSPWWETYVYLRSRSPLMINSNYYGLSGCAWQPKANRFARLGKFIHSFLNFKRLLDHEDLEPFRLKGLVPLCMSQYERMFSTTRVPGDETDELIHYDRERSRHVAVLCRGQWFRVFTIHRNGDPLSALEFRQQLEWIHDNAPKEACDHSNLIPALTTMERTKWSQIRHQYFCEGVNAKSLNIIERAIFVVVLDDNSPESLSDQGLSLLMGEGHTRWFDKSVSLISFANGKVGINVEHSWADAPVIAHMWEWCHTAEMNEEAVYTKDGDLRVNSENGFSHKSSRPLFNPQPLAWDMKPGLIKRVTEAHSAAVKAISDIDLSVFAHSDFGKGLIKKRKCSPDAFVQMALQLAYYRDQGHFNLTYEASMTRLFRDGRTETVRSCSEDSCAFVRSMDDKNASKEQRIALLRTALNTHVEGFKRAMTGNGIDRHLFGLYVVSKGVGVDSPFLKEALSMPWRLSTSQQPQSQTDRWNPAAPENAGKGMYLYRSTRAQLNQYIVSVTLALLSFEPSVAHPLLLPLSLALSPSSISWWRLWPGNG